jgi:hypothetical protein
VSLSDAPELYTYKIYQKSTEVKTMIQNKKGSDSIKIFRSAPQLTFSRRRREGETGNWLEG